VTTGNEVRDQLLVTHVGINRITIKLDSLKQTSRPQAYRGTITTTVLGTRSHNAPAGSALPTTDPGTLRGDV
jgi:hypothetical protein